MMERSRRFVIHERECKFEHWADLAGERVRWRTLISADRAPTDSMSVGITEHEPGEDSRLHLHRHASPEVYYILSDSEVVRICDEKYRVGTGTAIFVPGNAEHELRNDGSGVLRILYVFPVHSYDEIDYEFSGP